jgi:SAM-dependent methyltransferase
MAEVSVNFDRAAAVYDATRGFPPETEAELADIVATELSGRIRCLEIGVGTGRIAIPLRRKGVDMYGVDISVGMLTELLRKGDSGRAPAVDHRRRRQLNAAMQRVRDWAEREYGDPDTTIVDDAPIILRAYDLN